MTGEKPGGRKPSFETIGSAVAMLIGVVALFVAWDQAQVMRKQQHASVWPILTIDRSFNMKDDIVSFEFWIENAGVGPAVLKSARLRAGSEELSTWNVLRDRLPEPLAETERTHSASIGGRALAPGVNFAPYGLYWRDLDDPRAALRLLNATFSDVSVDVCYCSVFDQCWIGSSLVDAEPQKVKTCPQGADGI